VVDIGFDKFVLLQCSLPNFFVETSVREEIFALSFDETSETHVDCESALSEEVLEIVHIKCG
jgi:hypothetical protein